MSTKDSDLSMAAGCSICHAIVDRTHEGWKVIAQRYPGAFQERLRLANQETIAMWVMMDLIKVEGAE